MDTTSTYLRYLPPVLWADGPSEVTLGTTLRIMEKVLTGIDDGVLPPGGRPAITDEVARLHRLFDPWTTPAEKFLPWLASWVALEFPTLQDVPLWDEYQRRKVTAEIAQIYRLRGRKAGLNQYLDLYAVGRTRPRVALDDGTRLLSLTPNVGALATVAGLVTQGPTLVGRTVRAEGVARPWSVAVASDGSLLVVDTAVPAGAAVQLTARAWHLDATGRPDVAGSPPRPVPLGADTLGQARLVAVAVRPARGAAPETAYLLDRTGRLFSVPAPFHSTTATLVTSLGTAAAPVSPVAMTVDPANGDLLVLDRGAGPGSPNPPGVITVRPDPLGVSRNALAKVQEPLSICVEPDGTLLVGDGGDQDPASPAGFPGDLLCVDRGAGWTHTSVLAAGHPLVAPTGLARTADGRLYVLDAGLKPLAPSATNPFICEVAEPAAVYEVDLAGPAAVLARITEPGQFVYPTGLAAAGGRLLVCDPGQPEVAGQQSFWSRVRPFMFDVVIHFAASRLPSAASERQRVLNQAVGNIRTITDAQRPAHTVWNLITAI
ncbi:phage tail protein [Micromonospora sp. NPDC005299]|uniref:phage tail protein n=1 Tax=Micromonospora sp. NPDC005299 TaxID=3364231 RepID=UPI0036871024